VGRDLDGRFHRGSGFPHEQRLIGAQRVVPIARRPHGRPMSAHPPRALSLVVAIASITAVGVGISLAVPLLSLTLAARGVVPGWIGANSAAWGLASLVVTPFVPTLAARLGLRPLLAGSILLGAAVLPLFYLVGDFWLWFPLRFLSGGALATTFVLSEFWIAAAAPRARRGLVMGIYATVLSIGFALGPGVLALAGTGGALPFLTGSLIIGLAALPVIAAPVESPVIGARRHGGFARFLGIAPAATAAAFVFGMAESGSFALLPVYGSHLGYKTESVVFLAAAMTLGNVALQVPLGILSDRVDRRRLLLVSAVVGCLGAAALPFLAGAFLPTLVLLFAWGGFSGGLYTVGLAHLAQRFASADLAAANSAFVFAYAAGALVGPAILGLGMEVSDPHGFAIVLAAAFLAYVVLVLTRIATAGS
jgi:MFS family permease